jgi:hypothetical protein
VKKWILLAGAVLALGWFGLWGVSAWTAKGNIEAWFEAQRAVGWDASYSDLSVRGFPSRVDVTLTDVHLMDPDRGTGWNAPFFQILGLSYKPGHHILIWPNQQELVLPQGRVSIDSTGLRASLIRSATGEILRANVEAEALNIDGPDRAIAFTGLRAAAQTLPGTTTEALYRLGMTAQAMAGAQGPLSRGTDKTDGLQIQAEVGFDRIWQIDALAGPRPQPRQIDLRLAEYRFEGLEMRLAGRLSVDPLGRATGETTLRAVNWREMLERARVNSHIPDGVATALESALSLAASLKGKPDTLDLSLAFEKGRMSLGQIPLGTGPLLALP